MVEVLEDHHHRTARGQALEEGPPGTEELLRPDPRLDTQQGQEGRRDPGPLRPVGNVRLEHRGDPGPRRRLVIVLLESRPTPDHLAECPERDPVAIGGTPAVVPPDTLDEAVHVLQELPGQAGLPDSGRPDHADEARSALATGRVEEVLQLPEFLVATDERCLEGLGPADAAALRDDAKGAPGGDGTHLALEDLVGRGLEDDGAPRCALGGLPDEHGRGRGHALEAARRVDHVAGDHALVGGAEGDRRLAREDPGPDLDPGAQAAHGVDEVQGGADRSFRVVLVRDRGAPQRHHRIADELLDGAAVAGDDLAHGVEVAGLEFAHLLGVAALGERREPHEIREEDAHEASLSGGVRGSRRCCGCS